MDTKDLIGLMEAYSEVYAPQEEIEEATYSAKAARAGKDIGKPGKQFAKIAKSAAERYGSKERGEKVAGAVLAKLRKEDFDIFDTVLEFLQSEGYAETLEEAEWMMANELDAEDIEAILEAEGSYGQTPKARTAMGKLEVSRRTKPVGEYSQRGEKTRKVKAAEKHNRRMDSGPDVGHSGKRSTRPRFDSGRGKMDQDSRDFARGESEMDRGDYGRGGGSGSITKNPKKLRKQKAMGEHD